MRSIGFGRMKAWSPTERWTSCMSSRAAASTAKAREIDVGDKLFGRSRSQRSFRGRRSLGDPKPRRFHGHRGSAQTRSLVRILSAIGLLQMPPKKIE